MRYGNTLLPASVSVAVTGADDPPEGQLNPSSGLGHVLYQVTCRMPNFVSYAASIGA